ncbi:MAG TPA: type II and III secretion system protein family protein [Candidatus Polarisedimenticolia bacterium]|nr:type II and III secretion system protein family protein [Candidatus Polarisedimenticolia bacterium]
MRHAFRTVSLVALLVAPALPAKTGPSGAESPERVINFIGHEVSGGATRVILHADGPIDYRGGILNGDQVILDLANVRTSLPLPFVELGAPQVDRVVIGPEITKDGERLLKIRLTGVRARSHKVQAKDNELLIDLTPLKGPGREEKGLPKIIRNEPEVTASMAPAPAPPAPSSVRWAKTALVEGGESAMEATAAGEPVVTRIERPAAAAPSPSAPAAAAPVPAPAQPEPAPTAAAAPPAMVMAAIPQAGEADDRVLKVAAGRSLTLETGVPVTRLSVSNPSIAEPVAISPTQILINGLAPGIGSLVLWPKQGAPILYELAVHLDTTAIAQQLHAIFPAERVRVQSSKDSLILSGSVSNSDVAEKILKLAADFSPKVMNHLEGPGVKRRQVMLKVKFAEVSKSAFTELGAVLHHVDPTNPLGFDRGTSGTGEFSPPFGNLLNQPEGPDISWGDAINLSFFEKSIDLGLFITALKSRGLFQELAEPTLIAADGQDASFLAGGEFPVPIAQPGANFVSVTVEWKKFGISLDFRPTIRNDGVIVMKVKPEVSSLDFNNAVLIEGFRIPSLIVRRADTEVELHSGQSFAIAGLYDRNLLTTKSKIPVLGDIPLLGYLFRSKNLQKNQSELLVIVTPTIVQPLGSESEHQLPAMPESFDMPKPARKATW